MRTALALILLALASCGNPVKKVLASPDMTGQVIQAYVIKHPPKNDTVYMPGDTLTRAWLERDSIPLPYPVNHRYTERHYKETLVRDTIQIIDRTLLAEITQRLTLLEENYRALEKDRDAWKHAAQLRLWLLIGLGVLTLGGLAAIILLKLKLF